MAGPASIHRIRSVRLVSVEDAGYLAAMSAQALEHRRYGPKEEPSATYRVSSRVEFAVREWLAARVPLIEERVIAAEVLYRGARQYVPLFLELDAVQGRDGVPTRIFEIKFTSNLAAVLRGLGQLSRALHLLRARYDRVDGLAVVVHGSRNGFDRDDPRLGDVEFVTADALGHASLSPRAILEVDLAEIAVLLSDEERELLELAQDEGDASVAARRERAARPGEHEPGLDEDARTVPQAERRPGATLSFDGGPGDGPVEDSPFAVLRGLVDSDGR